MYEMRTSLEWRYDMPWLTSNAIFSLRDQGKSSSFAFMSFLSVPPSTYSENTILCAGYLVT